jgi:uncharacterized membrane protein
MDVITMPRFAKANGIPSGVKTRRIESVDLLRGLVMIIMALDHVRHTFHHDAYLYDPTDLTRTNIALFFTRWITHYCAPVFVFLAGISAYLYGAKKTKTELSYYLFTRGLWMIFVELFVISLGQTFNPTYPMFNLQVIWAIGISMIALSVLIYMKWYMILATAISLMAAHNIFDSIHVTGTGIPAFFWAFLHEPGVFHIGRLIVYIKYPVLPWIGIITMGYFMGSLYSSHYDPEKRKRTLFILGSASLALFYFLRVFNLYGDPAPWSFQPNAVFSLLSFLNVTKYPPSLLYILVTLGPAMIFLSLAEKPLNVFTKKIIVFGRVPFFYYVVHLYLIHLFAMFGAKITGYKWSDMILSDTISRVPQLRGFGFDLSTVYLIWIVLICIMYPCCKWWAQFKNKHQAEKWWLSYL